MVHKRRPQKNVRRKSQKKLTPLSANARTGSDFLAFIRTSTPKFRKIWSFLQQTVRTSSFEELPLSEKCPH